MAYRWLYSNKLVLKAGVLGTGALLLPKTTVRAEAPPPVPLPPAELQLDKSERKPIYDDFPSSSKDTAAAPEELSQPSPSLPPSSPQPSSKPSTSPGRTVTITPSPSPTDRLAVQIGRARHFIQAHVAVAEDSVNAALTRALDLENSFTSTIASLAPPPETGERVLPGALYVLVAAMAGSIVVRNRNILLRASVPVAVGVGAGWVVLPYTMRNVGDLVWQFEERVPAVAVNHLRIRGAAEEAWRQARVWGEAVSSWTDERVKSGREAVEGWVRQGK